MKLKEMIKRTFSMKASLAAVFALIAAVFMNAGVQAAPGDPLTFTALEPMSTISLRTYRSASPKLETSLNDGEWLPYTSKDVITLTNNGDRVAFRAAQDNSKMRLTSSQDHFTMTGKIAASGDVTTMLVPSGTDTFGVGYVMQSMFLNCTALVTPPELPAVNLTSNCYAGMFSNCTSLVSVPLLPAKKLPASCYKWMFMDCSSITEVEEFPATEVAESCCRMMFSGCTSLTEVPDLMPENLASQCYYAMFSNCTSLVIAPDLPAKKLYPSCYHFMFGHCTSLEVPPDLPAKELKNFCYESMFRDCTKLVTPPVMLAELGKQSGCHAMFSNCTSLVSAPDIRIKEFWAQDVWDMFTGCTNLTSLSCAVTNEFYKLETLQWLENVAPKGAIECSDELWEQLSKDRSGNGVPPGWARAVARVGSMVYGTIAEAIKALPGGAPLATIKVLDTSAPCPEGYLIQDGEVIDLSQMSAKIGTRYFRTCDAAVGWVAEDNGETLGLPDIEVLGTPEADDAPQGYRFAKYGDRPGLTHEGIYVNGVKIDEPKKDCSVTTGGARWHYVAAEGKVYLDTEGSAYIVCGFVGSGVQVDYGKAAVVVLDSWIARRAPRVIAPYLQEIQYDYWRKPIGAGVLKSLPADYPSGGCTACWNGRLAGRNLDWKWDDAVTYLLRMPAAEGRHASIGIVHGPSDDSDKSYMNSRLWEWLPGMTYDGINDAGVYINVNMVAAGETNHARTTGTNPGKQPLNIEYVPRFVLDNADSPAHAIELLKERDIYAVGANEFHWLIASSNEAYIVECVDSELVVIKAKYREAVMANFHVSNSPHLEDYDVVLNAAKTGAEYFPWAIGIERYDRAAEGIDEITDSFGMLRHMKKNWYASGVFGELNKASDYRLWWSENNGGASEMTRRMQKRAIGRERFPDFYDYRWSLDDRWEDRNDRTKTGALLKYSFENASRKWAEAQERFADTGSRRDENGEFIDLWQTTHTCAYDLEKKSLAVMVQENFVPYYVDFESSYGEVAKKVAAVDGVPYEDIGEAIKAVGEDRPLTGIEVLDPDAPCPGGYVIQDKEILEVSRIPAMIGDRYYKTFEEVLRKVAECEDGSLGLADIKVLGEPDPEDAPAGYTFIKTGDGLRLSQKEIIVNGVTLDNPSEDFAVDTGIARWHYVASENRIYLDSEGSAYIVYGYVASGIEIDYGNAGVAVLDSWIAHRNLREIAPYFQEVQYDYWNKAIGVPVLRSLPADYPSGGCTACWNGRYVGRNMDWKWDDAMTYLIRMPAAEGRHASIGIAHGPQNDLDETYTPTRLWEWLPSQTYDGINDAGVYINVNMVAAGETNHARTTGTNPGKPTLNVSYVPRFVLDNADSPAHAIELLKERSIYAVGANEFHWFIANSNEAYIVECVDNELVVLKALDGEAAISNFHVSNSPHSYEFDVVFNEAKTGTNYFPWAIGLERYDRAKSGLAAVSSRFEMLQHMTNNWFAAGTFGEANLASDFRNWWTENSGYASDITDRMQRQEVGEVLFPGFQDHRWSLDDRWEDRDDRTRTGFMLKKSFETACKEWAEAQERFAYTGSRRDENGEYIDLWQTVHTCAYDLEKKSFAVMVQENFEPYYVDFESSYGEVVKPVAVIDEVPYESIAAAIAALADGQTPADIEIIDPKAPCPDGYAIQDGALIDISTMVAKLGDRYFQTYEEAFRIVVLDNGETLRLSDIKVLEKAPYGEDAPLGYHFNKRDGVIYLENFMTYVNDVRIYVKGADGSVTTGGAQWHYDAAENKLYLDSEGAAYIVNGYVDSGIAIDYGKAAVVVLDGRIAHRNLREIAPGLQEIQYDYWNQSLGARLLRSMPAEYPSGGCTACWNGRYVGRNLDWTWDDAVTYLVRMPAAEGRHASIGVAHWVLGNSEDSYTQSRFWELLPGHTLDGINDAGVYISVNVVAAGETNHARTTGTNPGESRLNFAYVPRFVLDKADSPTHAVELLKERNLYAVGGIEVHWLIASSNEAYIVECVDNELVVIKAKDREAAMTNFHVSNSPHLDEYDLCLNEAKTGTEYFPWANGIERYDSATNGLAEVSSRLEMLCHMTNIWFAAGVNGDANVASEFKDWWSENNGMQSGITDAMQRQAVGEVMFPGFKDHYWSIDDRWEDRDDPSKTGFWLGLITEYFYDLWLGALERYAETGLRTDENGEYYPLWQSVHTCAYDLEKKSLAVVVQENFEPYYVDFESDYGEVVKPVAVIGEVPYESAADAIAVVEADESLAYDDIEVINPDEIELPEGYEVVDGRISRAMPRIDFPTPLLGLVYNAGAQVGISPTNNLSEAVKDSMMAIDAGEYTAVVAPAPGFYWKDGSVTNISVTFSIAKAKLTVTAKDAGCAAGEEPPALGYETAGWAGDDSWELYEQKPEPVTDYTKGTVIEAESKTFPIYFKEEFELDNYTIEFVNGTLTVRTSEKPDPDMTAIRKNFPEESFEAKPVIEDGVLLGFDIVLTADIEGTLAIDDDLGNIFLDLNGHSITGSDGESAVLVKKGEQRSAATTILFRDGAQTETSGVFGGKCANAVDFADGVDVNCSYGIDFEYPIRLEGGEGAGSIDAKIVNKPDGGKLQTVVDSTTSSEPPAAVEGFSEAVAGVAGDATRVVLDISDPAEKDQEDTRKAIVDQNPGYQGLDPESLDFVCADITVRSFRNGDRGEDIHELDGMVRITLAYDLAGKSQVKVWRRHEGALEELPEGEANAKDGEYWTGDCDNGRITLLARKFSIYMISAVQNPVCRIGDVEYMSVQDALDAARSGDTITLLKNVDSVTLAATNGAKTVTIDLAGKNISSGAVDVPVFRVAGGTSLRIADSGALSLVTGGFEVADGGALEIAGGSYTSDPSKYLNGGCGMKLNADGTYSVLSADECPSLAYDHNEGMPIPTKDLNRATTYAAWLTESEAADSAILGGATFKLSKPVKSGKNAGLIKVKATVFDAATRKTVRYSGEGHADDNGTLDVVLFKGKEATGLVRFQGASVVGIVALGSGITYVDGGLVAAKRTDPVRYEACRSTYKGVWTVAVTVTDADNGAIGWIISAKVAASGSVSVKAFSTEGDRLSCTTKLLVGKEGWAAIPVIKSKKSGKRIASLACVMWLDAKGGVAVTGEGCRVDFGGRPAKSLTSKAVRAFASELEIVRADGTKLERDVDFDKVSLSYAKATGIVSGKVKLAAGESRSGKTIWKQFKINGVAVGDFVICNIFAKDMESLLGYGTVK